MAWKSYNLDRCQEVHEVIVDKYLHMFLSWLDMLMLSCRYDVKKFLKSACLRSSQLYIYDKQKWYGNIIWVIWKTIFKIELLITKTFNNGFFFSNLILHSYSTIDSFCRTSLNFCFFRSAIRLLLSSGNCLSSLTGTSLERLWSERLLFKATEGLISIFTSSNVLFVFLSRLCLFFLFLCLSFSGHFASCHSDSSKKFTSKNKNEKNLKYLI